MKTWNVYLIGESVPEEVNADYVCLENDNLVFYNRMNQNTNNYFTVGSYIIHHDTVAHVYHRKVWREVILKEEKE